MLTKVIPLTNENVTLTAYVLDSAPEMPYLNVRPAVLVCPGGGYRFLSDREAEPVAMAFLAMGFNAFVLRYSIKEASEFPRPLNDAEEALEHIRAHADEYNTVPDKIAVCGFSAGGHLAAALATMGRVRPNAMILCYACLAEDICSNDRVLAFKYPPLVDKVDDKTPPAFIFSTCGDGCVPIHSSVAMMDALDKAGISFESHIFSTGDHGLSLSNCVTSKRGTAGDNPDCAKWVAMCQSWLYRLFVD